uniref:Uncharacterized protein n=1 Tax=Arundo donax TaxID=35708 RepID=A0A0A9B042_ARUDO
MTKLSWNESILHCCQFSTLVIESLKLFPNVSTLHHFPNAISHPARKRGYCTYIIDVYHSYNILYLNNLEVKIEMK